MQPHDNHVHSAEAEHRRAQKADLVCPFHEDQESCIQTVKNRVDKVFYIMVFTAGASGFSAGAQVLEFILGR